ncbi:MAG TPA: hypothetical protein VIJ60_01715 [Acidimicrobiales bacterium]
MAWHHKSQSGPPAPPAPPPTVRVLRDDQELAAAAERAAEGQRRLQVRLEARAARDEWMAERRQAQRQGLSTLSPARPDEAPSPRTPAA